MDAKKRQKKAKKIQKKIDEYSEKLEYINEAISMVENQLKGDRLNPPKNTNDLEKKCRDTQKEIDRVVGMIQICKSRIINKKQSISELKNEYEKLPKEQKPAKLQSLSTKITPMGAKIVEWEGSISSWEMQKHAVEQAHSMAEANLIAFNEGLHLKPIEEDPRMKGVIKEKERIEKILDKKKRKLAKRSVKQN